MKNEYEVKYKILMNYLTELSKKSYITNEDIKLILKIIDIDENEECGYWCMEEIEND